MKNLKSKAYLALMAGVLALPLTNANAESGTGLGVGVNADVKTSNSTATPSDNTAGIGANADTNVTARTYSALDTDRSGGLSQSEYLKMEGAGDFDALDTNGDSILSMNEIRSSASSDTNVNSTRD